MRPSLIVSAAIGALALGGLLSCSPDSVLSPERDFAPLMDHQQSEVRQVLTVDDDRHQCRRADFTTIQEAVTAAEPGTTILVCAGTYIEQVLITKNGLRLVAKGRPGTVILDGLDDHDMIAGFQLQNAHGNVIEGFVVRNYHEANILLHTGSSRNTIRKNVATSSSHHDGIQVFNSPRNVIEHNKSFDNVSGGRVACGINVIGPESVGNIVRHNETFGNDFGIQVVAGAANNLVFRNVSHDNRRIGIRIIGANGTVIRKNVSRENGGAPAPSEGWGILVQGSSDVMVENNRSLDNTGSGIRVLLSNLVKVVRNTAFDNEPDLFWDEAGANTFKNNRCETSTPAGLCEHDDDDDDV
jgi:parallel beta-helix repeat protein